MESGLGVTRKGRKLGSSRRRQMREPADGQDVLVAPEPESWSSQSAEELQSFFQDCGAEERGFVTREDLAVSPRPYPIPWIPLLLLLRLPFQEGRPSLLFSLSLTSNLLLGKARDLFILRWE